MALADVQERLPRLIEELREAGDSVEIELGGRVVARLEPGEGSGGPLPDQSAEFIVHLFDGLPDDLVDAFVANLEGARSRELPPLPVDFGE